MKIGAAKFGHPVKGPDANLGLCFLIFEVARFELVPDDSLAAAHLRLNPAAYDRSRMTSAKPFDHEQLCLQYGGHEYSDFFGGGASGLKIAFLGGGIVTIIVTEAFG